MPWPFSFFRLQSLHAYPGVKRVGPMGHVGVRGSDIEVEFGKDTAKRKKKGG